MSERPSGLPERLRIGASSWSAPSWQGVFYPAKMDPAGFLGYYAGRFDTVEVDDRLERFLPTLPAGRRLAVEVRNKRFVVPRLLDLLRRHGVALAWIDHPWFYRADEMAPETLTADFSYIRWLGDRQGIERRTKSWDRMIVDRSGALRSWTAAIRTMLEEPCTVYGYFNNHYAGYAVGSIEQFREMWGAEAAGAS